MQIHRRTILTGAAALPLVSLPLSRAWAPPPPAKGVYAVHFGGATVLLCPAENLDFPEFAQYIFVHAKVSCPFAITGATHTLFDLGMPGGGSIMRTKFYTGNQTGQAGLQIGATGSGSGVGVISPPGSLPANQWFDLKVSLDANAGIISVTIDDGPVPGLASVLGFTQPFSVPLWASPVSGGGSVPLWWGTGRSVFPTPASWLVGDTEDLFIAVTSTPIDLTAQTVKNAFTDPATGAPIYLPDDGRGVLPSGDNPGILLHGPTSYYGGNLAKSDFTWPATQTHPGEFVVNGAALTVPANDPWGFVGV